MIVQSVQTLISRVRENFHRTVYKTEVDPKTMKEYVTSEVYTQKGTVEQLPDMGSQVDKKA